MNIIVISIKVMKITIAFTNLKDLQLQAFFNYFVSPVTIITYIENIYKYIYKILSILKY